MKIGILLDSTLDSPDGVQQFVLQIGAHMARQGHEVHYLVGESKRTDVQNVHSLSRNVKVAFNGNVISSPLPISRHAVAKLLDSLELDIIHVQTPFSPLLAGKVLRAAKRRNIPVVSTFHILPYGLAGQAGNVALGAWLRLYTSAITLSVAVSKPAATYAQKHYGLHSHVIPNPITVADFSTARATNAIPKIVFLGRLVERKGSMKLLQALAYMSEHKLYSGEYTAVIAGKGALAEDLQSFASSHGLTNIVTFPGFIAEEDKGRLLASADIAVFPSTSGESFGISLLEAFAASSGVVLAGDNPGYASVVPDDRNLITPNNTENFAKALAYWLENSQQRQEMADLQKDYVKQFDILRIGALYESVYSEALQSVKDS